LYVHDFLYSYLYPVLICLFYSLRTRRTEGNDSRRNSSVFLRIKERETFSHEEVSILCVGTKIFEIVVPTVSRLVRASFRHHVNGYRQACLRSQVWPRAVEGEGVMECDLTGLHDARLVRPFVSVFLRLNFSQHVQSTAN